MKIFAIGDLHLSFASDKPMDVFGSHWQEHAKRLAAHWQEKITEADCILIPGDISWALRLKEADADLRWLNDLPGKKICIRGNHDYWWDRPNKLNKAYDKITFLQNTAIMMGHLAICGTRGWECVSMQTVDQEATQERMIQREWMRLKLSLDAAMQQGAEEIWVMLHYPPAFIGETGSPFIDLMKKYPVTKVIYGHLHDEGSWQTALKGKVDGMHYYLVAADYLAFEPQWIATI